MSEEIIDNGHLISEEMQEEIENTTPVNSRAVSSSATLLETPDVSHQASASYQRSRPQLSSLDSLLDSTESTQSHSGEFVYFFRLKEQVWSSKMQFRSTKLPFKASTFLIQSFYQ